MTHYEMLANKQSKSCEGPVVASQALNNSQQLSATLNNSQHLSTRFPMSWFLRIQSKKCNNRKQTFHVCEGPLVVGSVTVLKSLNLLSMKLQIKCLRIQLEKTGKQTVLLCASPVLVENANWWDLKFVQSNPKSSFWNKFQSKFAIVDKQMVHACEGLLVRSANCQTLKFRLIKFQIYFSRMQLENRYWFTISPSGLWRSTGMECQKLSRATMFLNHTPHEFSQKPVGKSRLRNNHVCESPVLVGRNANCQDFKCLSIKLHMKKFPTIMSENRSWQTKQSTSVHKYDWCNTQNQSDLQTAN